MELHHLFLVHLSPSCFLLEMCGECRLSSSMLCFYGQMDACIGGCMDACVQIQMDWEGSPGALLSPTALKSHPVDQTRSENHFTVAGSGLKGLPEVCGFCSRF